MNGLKLARSIINIARHSETPVYYETTARGRSHNSAVCNSRPMRRSRGELSSLAGQIMSVRVIYPR